MISMDYRITFTDDSQAYLMHYGVAGMRWGQQSELTKLKYSSGNGGQYHGGKTIRTLKSGVIHKSTSKDKAPFGRRDAHTTENTRTKQARKTGKDVHNTGVSVTIGKNGAITNEEYNIYTGEWKQRTFSKAKHKNRPGTSKRKANGKNKADITLQKIKNGLIMPSKTHATRGKSALSKVRGRKTLSAQIKR